MEKKYESEALMVCHQSAKGLHRLGIINDTEMNEYDEGCLVKDPEPVYNPKKSPTLEYATA